MTRPPWMSPVITGKPLPYGLVSLWDMLRFHLDEFATVLTLLRGEEEFSHEVSGTDHKIQKEIVESLVRLTRNICDQLNLPTTRDRLDRIQTLLTAAPLIALPAMPTECRVLRETLVSEASRRYLFHANETKAELYASTLDQSLAISENFPDADKDLLAAYECYAYEQNTACVFHCMRVLEHGLRALARSVKVEFGVEVWHTVLTRIEAAIKVMQGGPRGRKKQATLQFYSEAAKEFFYFKDGWRNYAAHSRAGYDEHQAASVLQHVLAFMAHISKKLKGRKRAN